MNLLIHFGHLKDQPMIECQVDQYDWMSSWSILLITVDQSLSKNHFNQQFR